MPVGPASLRSFTNTAEDASWSHLFKTALCQLVRLFSQLSSLFPAARPLLHPLVLSAVPLVPNCVKTHSQTVRASGQAVTGE